MSIVKFIRNQIRLWRFNNRGWAMFGKLIANSNDSKLSKRYIKFSNWYYNLGYKGIMFKGTK